MEAKILVPTQLRVRVDGARPALGELLAAFLRGPNAARAEMAGQAAALLRDEHELVAVLVVDAADYVDPPEDPSSPARLRHRTDGLLSAVGELYQVPEPPVLAEMGEGELALLVRPASSELAPLKHQAAAIARQLVKTLRCHARVGVGLPHRGLAGMVRSYQDARAALANAEVPTVDGVYCLDGAGLAGLLDGISRATRRALAERLLTPLAEDPYLSATLDAYFAADCSPGAAAQALGLHRNTLAYRLGRIAALTGLDPRRFEDAVQLRVAIQLRGTIAD